MSSGIEAALAGIRAAVDELGDHAERCAGVWTQPRAPGKWSPSQNVEHVAISIEEWANEAAGVRSKFPRFPGFARPLVRALFFRRVLRKQGFPKAKTIRSMNPPTGPATPSAARERLEQALARLEQACRASAQRGGIVNSSLFGGVPVEDFVRFQELHVRHHSRQMPAMEAVRA